MSGPLSGVKVIELAGIGPGPFSAMLLSDMGADVLHIDRLQSVERGADPGAVPVMDRGRRSVGVDLKHPDGVETVLRLVEQADALTEGFRPGVTERLGIGPDVCLARNPRLVYGRMTGWGQEGPMANAAGHDINYISLAGALAHFGRAGGKPTPPINLIGDFGGGGMFLAFGVVCALFEAQRSGQGQVVDAAMVDGTAILMSMFWGLEHLGAFSEELGTNVLDTGRALLRHLRDVRREVHLTRLARAAVLRRVDGAHRARRRGTPRADGPRRLAGAARAVHRAVQVEDARRVVRDPRGHRRVLRAGAPAERGGRAPAHQGAGHDHRARRPRCSPRRRRASRARRDRSSVPVRRRGSTPTKPSPTGASAPTTSRKLRDAKAIA